MDDFEFLESTLDDLESAHNAGCDAFNAIDDLQRTDLWVSLPIETRKALCAARAHLDALTDQLAHIV